MRLPCSAICPIRLRRNFQSISLTRRQSSSSSQTRWLPVLLVTLIKWLPPNHKLLASSVAATELSRQAWSLHIWRLSIVFLFYHFTQTAVLRGVSVWCQRDATISRSMCNLAPQSLIIREAWLCKNSWELTGGRGVVDYEYYLRDWNVTHLLSFSYPIHVTPWAFNVWNSFSPHLLSLHNCRKKREYRCGRV